MTDAQKRTVGYALRDGQGKLLRRFIITDGGKYLNQWSYYQDGFEVYRENDLDGDRTLDECRWLNAGGTRVAVIKSGKIAGWKRISAEEASKVLVQAFVGERPRAARVADGHPRGAGGRRRAQGCGRQGHRRGGQTRRGGRRPSEVTRRLDRQDRLEPVRRHLSARDPGRPGGRAGEGRRCSTRTR